MKDQQEIKHGVTAYSRGCRCDVCKAARSEVVKRSNAKRREARLAYNKAWNAANPERIAAADRRFRENNPQAAKAKHKRWRDSNLDAERERTRAWFAANPEYYDDYRRTPRGRGLRAALLAKRRAIIKNALANADARELATIREIYANCPLGYEVDHVVPISKNGTHHSSNLQYLPAETNRKKAAIVNYTAIDALHWRDIVPSTTIPVTGVGASAPKRTEAAHRGL